MHVPEHPQLAMSDVSYDCELAGQKYLSNAVRGAPQIPAVHSRSELGVWWLD
jgi:hypothetical protein